MPDPPEGRAGRQMPDPPKGGAGQRMPDPPGRRAAFIRVAGLRYRYRRLSPDWILKGIDLAIGNDAASPGATLIFGASGSGKSTLCRTFNGLIPHFYGGAMEGRVTVDGHDTAALGVEGLFHRVGMVFQNPEAQLFNRTVEREIAFGLESLGLDREEMRRRVAAAAGVVGIGHLLHRDPQGLSGGEQQLTVIAAILAPAPRLMVLDEPYANLDPAGVGRVRRALRAVRREGTAVVIVEHRLGYAAPDVDRMVTLEDGLVMADGPPPAAAMGRSPRVGDAAASGAIIPGSMAGRPAATGAPSLAASPSPPAPATDDAMPLLRVRGLTHEAGGRHLLDAIDLDLRCGESVALLGGNGAGKTTLLRHVMGLLRPSAGRIWLEGSDIRKMKVSDLARRVGLAFQNPHSQFFKLTVRAEIAAGPMAMGCLDAAWMDEVVDIFGLDGLMDRSPFKLSGGEKKRVAFAAALAARPRLLLLDEPTAGQDGHFLGALEGFLKRMRQDGRAVMFATHDLDFAARNADRWLIMADGRLLADGPPGELAANGDLMRRACLLQEPEPEPETDVSGAESAGGIGSGTGSESDAGAEKTLLDPRALLALTLCFAAAVVGAAGIVPLSIQLAGLLALILAIGQGEAYGRWLRLALPMALFFGGVTAWAGGAAAGFGAGLKLFTLTTLFFAFFALTAPEDLGNALVRAGLPYAAAFVMAASMQFVPVMGRKAAGVMAAQRARGIPLEPGWRALRHYAAFLTPLMLQSFQLADELAEAMAARGFGRPGRTFYKEYRLRVRDWVTMAGGAGMLLWILL